MTVPLRRFQDILWAVDVEFADASHTFLFDTGAGITSLDAAVAEQAGLTPTGRLTGHRMTGERVDLGVCRDVDLGIGGCRVPHRTLGVVDLAAFLPAGFPPVGGVVGLNSFEDGAVTFDLAAGALTLETKESYRARTETMARLKSRFEYAATGVSRVVFLEARGKGASVWLQLDTANTGPVVLAPHARRQLGLEANDPAPFEVVGDRIYDGRFVVKEILIDGNLGATWCDGRIFTLGPGRTGLWVRSQDKPHRDSG